MKKLWRELGLPAPKSEASRGRLSLADNEVYSGIEVPTGPFFIRLDGWGFHGLARRLGLRKPFDKKFAECLAEVAKGFFVPFNPVLAYVFSDEISLLFLSPTAFRRVEKIDYVFAGIASTMFLVEARKRFGKQVGPVAFDCRVIPVRGAAEARKYLAWRQAECFRNHNNAWAQWVMERKGLGPAAVSKKLSGVDAAGLRAVAKKHGVDLGGTPAWQRNGLMVVWEHYGKKGFDPVKKKHVVVERRRPKTVWGAPLFWSEEGGKFISSLAFSSSSPA